MFMKRLLQFLSLNVIKIIWQFFVKFEIFLYQEFWHNYYQNKNQKPSSISWIKLNKEKRLATFFKLNLSIVSNDILTNAI